MADEPKDTGAPRAASGPNPEPDEATRRLRKVVASHDIDSIDPAPPPPDLMLMSTEVAAFVAASFSTAFVQALGKRAGDGFADLVRRHVRRKGKPDEYHIGTKDGNAATLVITNEIPDEARLALLDLDVTATELRGKELRWDEAAGEWRPSEAPGRTG
jgi:hypothetical protein